MSSARRYHSPRRAQEAAGTRRDILRAAQELFTTTGYGRVTVADIARRAGVAVQTVYASTGGKADVLDALVSEAIANSGAPETLEALKHTTDLPSALRVLAHGTRLGNENSQAATNLLFSAASVHEEADKFWTESLVQYRAALREAAVHLGARGLLADGLSVDRAAEILWYGLGVSSWRTLVKDCGWTWDDAEAWLARQTEAMLGR
jgi:AcrR family transcriptional regulator